MKVTLTDLYHWKKKQKMKNKHRTYVGVILCDIM